MSYANGTTHYNLPQTVGTDKRDWADPNQAFADIDAAIYGAVQDTAQAALDIDALETRMDTAEQGISTNAGNIAGLDTRLTTAEGAITSQGAQITDTRQDLEDMICAYNEASATSTHAYAVGDYFIYNDVLYKATQAIAIGDTIVPDTNCETTNVSSELLDIKSDIPSTDNFVTKNVINSYTEAGMVATRNYRAGEYILISNNIYKAMTAITSGDTLTVNTNVKLTSIGNELFENGHHLIAEITPSASETVGSLVTRIGSYLTGMSPEELSHVNILFRRCVHEFAGYSATATDTTKPRFDSYRIDATVSPVGSFIYEMYPTEGTYYTIRTGDSTTANLSSEVYNVPSSIPILIYT